jgi:uncharacterized protein (DUF2252 family)
MTNTNSKPPSPDEREAKLSALRNHKMARSVHAFVRGNTLQFYEWLEGIKGGALPEGPEIWIGGDCHVGNLGPVANVQGKIDVQIRDLDQTVIGNPAHDLIRLGLSLATAARDSVLSGVVTARMMEELMQGYEKCFDEKMDQTKEFPSPDTVKVTIKEAARRSWKDLATERIEDTTPHIPLGKKFWPISKEEREAIEKIFEVKNLFCHITSTGIGNENTTVKILDAAYWIKGCSSLGKLRYAVLIDAETAGGGKTERGLIDIKEAVKAAAPRRPGARMPQINGERVVEGARHLSPYLGDRIAATDILGRSVFIRELLPQDMKVEIKKLPQEEAGKVAHYLGMVVGNAHARQMDREVRKLWKKDLQRNRAKTLEAPSWLWSSVVELVASHEGAYLEHCRKHALPSMP